MILIDELDLLLHPEALKRMISVLKERAIDKKLQIIFTTHALTMLEMESDVSIRHILTTPSRTLCFDNTKPEAIHRLTGEIIQPLTIFVEDDFARAIVHMICHQMELSRYVAVMKYGAAKNAFTLAAGMIMQGKDIRKTLIVLDGDVFSTTEEQTGQIRQALVGDDPAVQENRDLIAEHISKFVLPEGRNPEDYIIEMIRNNGDLPEDYITRAVSEVHVGANNHETFRWILDRIGCHDQFEVGCDRIISIAAKSAQWETFIEPVKNWLEQQRDSIEERRN